MGSYQRGEPIKTLTAPDSSFYVDIVARDDGAFQYFQQLRIPDRIGQERCHTPGKVSGLYQTAADAESAARLDFKL